MSDQTNDGAKPTKKTEAAPVVATSPDMLMQLRDALQGEAAAVARRERGAIAQMLDTHDNIRAKMPTHKLVAVTDFTLVDDEYPMGKIVKMGEEFEVSEFDLQRFLGKGLPRANEPTANGGVTISQA